MAPQRVIYGKNPLIEVIIQLRFPKILALNTKDPVDFQEAIRDEYPAYLLTVENQQEITFTVNPDDAAAPIPSIVPKQPVKNHSFVSGDGAYKINLTNEFISLSTRSYCRWEEMLDHLKNPLAVFEKIYKPSFYERIGLRYIDAFSRDELGLGETPWSELIAPAWLGAISFTDEKRVFNSSLDIEYSLEQETERARIHTGLGTINNKTERVFVIDSDFMKIEPTKPNHSYDVLNFLHNHAKVFISKAIKRKLHLAMKPEKVK